MENFKFFHRGVVLQVGFLPGNSPGRFSQSTETGCNKYFSLHRPVWVERQIMLHMQKTGESLKRNNNSIALNVLSIPHKKKEIRQAYISKHNLGCSNRVIFPRITNGKKWHYLAANILSRLLRRIKSNHHGNYYCMNCLYPFRAESKLKSHENVCEDHDYCHMTMPGEDNNIFKYNQEKKTLKAPFAIYTDTDLLLEKIHRSDNNTRKSSTAISMETYGVWLFVIFTLSI